MSKKPEKKDCTNCPYSMLGKCSKWDKKLCYNNAYDDWEKWIKEKLPFPNELIDGKDEFMRGRLLGKIEYRQQALKNLGI